MSLSKITRRMLRAEDEALIRRLNWSYLDKQIELEFHKITKNKNDCAILGNLYLTRQKDLEPIKSAYLPSYTIMNSTHIYTGTRFLGVNIVDQEKKNIQIGFEKNAQLTYSQSPSGYILVIISPYKSNAGEIKEKEIILGRYNSPGQINNRTIRKHLSIFFKYCACTSQHSASKLNNYVYRLYLVYNDFRYKTSFRTKGFMVLNRLLLSLFTLVSLYILLTGGD